MCVCTAKTFSTLKRLEKVNSHFPIRFVKSLLAASLMLSSAIDCFPSEAVMKSRRLKQQEKKLNVSKT